MDTKLKNLLKPPFYHNSIGFVMDGNSRLVDVPGHRLSGEPDNGEQCAKVRGWGFFQYYENGAELQDAFMDFVVEALNEKCERDFAEPMRWVEYRDMIVCPHCKKAQIKWCYEDSYEETIYEEIDWKIFSYCPSCGQRLLPPEKK